MISILIAVALITILFLGWKSYNNVNKPTWQTPTSEFPNEWRNILKDDVLFYQKLDKNERARFEKKVQEFLMNCKVTGVKTTVSTRDRVLVGASAIIPIFGFDSWKYWNIREVLLYPNEFNSNYDFENGDDRNILGMVGNQSMEGIMILSKEALIRGFQNETDKHNTAIHEFVHLIDKTDGEVDGVPKVLMEKQYAIPWINLMNKEIQKIEQQKSDINPYGATNNAEFFSVISEYFFERPDLLEKNHPELFELLEKIFKQDLS